MDLGSYIGSSAPSCVTLGKQLYLSEPQFSHPPDSIRVSKGLKGMAKNNVTGTGRWEEMW